MPSLQAVIGGGFFSILRSGETETAAGFAGVAGAARLPVRGREIAMACSPGFAEASRGGSDLLSAGASTGATWSVGAFAAAVTGAGMGTGSALAGVVVAAALLIAPALKFGGVGSGDLTGTDILPTSGAAPFRLASPRCR